MRPAHRMAEVRMSRTANQEIAEGEREFACSCTSEFHQIRNADFVNWLYE